MTPWSLLNISSPSPGRPGCEPALITCPYEETDMIYAVHDELPQRVGLDKTLDGRQKTQTLAELGRKNQTL